MCLLDIVNYNKSEIYECGLEGGKIQKNQRDKLRNWNSCIIFHEEKVSQKIGGRKCEERKEEKVGESKIPFSPSAMMRKL